MIRILQMDGSVVRELRAAKIRRLAAGPPGRLLAVMADGSVREMDFFGNVTWTMPALPEAHRRKRGGVDQADHLPNGNVLAAYTVQVDPAEPLGKIWRVFEIDRSGAVRRALDIPCARSSPSDSVRTSGEGRLLVCFGAEPPFEISWDGRERRALGTDPWQVVLRVDEGRFIAGRRMEVAEIDGRGKVVWSASHMSPMPIVLPLPGGHVLAADC